MCQFVSPPDPAYQEAGEERIISWNSGPFLGVSMVLIICPLFSSQALPFFLLFFYLKGTSCCGKQCLDQFLLKIDQVAAAPKNYFRQPGFLSSEGTFSYYNVVIKSRSRFRKRNPRESYTRTAAVVIWLIMTPASNVSSKTSGGLLCSAPPAFLALISF